MAKNTKRKIIAAYLRVSSEDQTHDSQRAEVEACLRGEGIDSKNVRWFEDVGTGDTLDRPAFTELETLIASGRVQTVYVARLDRVSRKMGHGLNVIARWLDDGGVRFVSATQGFDFKGTVGKMVAAMLLGFAEIEQETRRQRQRAGIEVAKKKGVYAGRKRGAVKKGKKPSRAKKLREKGLTFPEIAEAMGISLSTARRYASS